MLRAAGNTIFLVLILLNPGFTQQIKPTGSFSVDSIRIGEPFNYSLRIRYPRNTELLFPDSTYSFAPFELLSYQPFTTRSDSTTSYDSTVYQLASYEIDSIQYLQLPVFIVQGGDSIQLLTELDSVILAHMITEIPDTITMRSNTGYNLVDLDFNYPYLIVGVTVSLLIVALVLVFFGKGIRKRIRLYRLKKAHRKFLEDFKTRLKNLDSNGKKIPEMEFLLWKWKDYMELLKKQPYTKLTTKEIKEIYPDNELAVALNEIDRAIYGGKHQIKVNNTFDFLRRVSEDSFHQKVEEIRNG